MNAKQIAAVLAIALAGSSAMAFEATQFDEPVSVLTPAAKSALESGKTVAPTAIVVSRQEATQFADVPAQRSRDEVRAEARAANRAHAFNSLYVGS
ncbi:MAG TPA: hypothetical protein VF169_19255 [Albitalea sp.]|uniref:hypothetical protein n=1 Tax=Piscinibacter sp. TaxID=1903157 RepID=UPI002ED36AE6